jgi:hypothetical protein
MPRLSSFGECRNLHGAARWSGALLRVVALALSAQASAAGPAVTPPAPAPVLLMPFQASYSWYWRGTRVAVSTITLAHRKDDTWVYSSVASPRGLGRLYPMRPSLESVMRITPNGVEPLSFKVSGSGASHDADVMFDWVAGRAVGMYEGSPMNMPIKRGVQDDLSVQIAMMMQLLAGHMPTMAFDLDKNSVREYDYVRDGTADLSTSIGPVPTVIYVAHHPGSPRVTRFWCAPSLGFIPMQVQQTRVNAVEWTMQIDSLKRG